MAKRTQKNRAIGINTPLGEDVLLLKGFVLNEEIGRPFSAQLDLRSEPHDIDFNTIIGQNVTIRVNRADGKLRYINGFISRSQQQGYPVAGGSNQYTATIVPWLWFLTRTADCRIFHERSVPEIVKEVFDEMEFTEFELALSNAYPQHEYVVQYRETAFNFVSRLLEHEGIYYFFKHEHKKHTLMLADSPAALEPEKDYKTVKYVGSEDAKMGYERIWEWSLEKRLQPGKTALRDFDFKATTKNLYAEKEVQRQHAESDYEVYDYPGGYIEPDPGKTYVATRLEEMSMQHEIARATGDVRGIYVGAKFKLEGFPSQDQARDYFVIGSRFRASVDEFDTSGSAGGEPTFGIEFSCVPADVQIRPARTTPKPRVAGPQTAIVVSAAEDDKEEIYTDEYGRVKVHFHWDRYNKADAKASCWIRVSQLWAGKKWGAVFTPRVGQEVIVDFLEGDPDQPVITGRLYNQECMPPYTLPDDKTKSTIKSCSSKGGQGFNEIRFEDMKDSEQFFMFAQKDMDVRVQNDSKEAVDNDRHLVVGNDQIEHVKNDRSETVDGHHKELIKKDRNV